MKIIGMIGGMSWESSAEYYRIINQTVRKLLGGQHSARSLMYTVDFHDIELLQREGRWEEAAIEMIACARRLERGGADFIVLCTNTMHKLAPEIESEISIPLLHIADAAAERIKRCGLVRVGLLGTKFTMEGDFYKDRLTKLHGLEVLLPDSQDREIIHDVIYNELCHGEIVADSRREYLRIIDQLAKQGAQGIILGCTEIPLLVKPEDSATQLFDTTLIHAEAAVALALQGEG